MRYNKSFEESIKKEMHSKSHKKQQGAFVADDKTEAPVNKRKKKAAKDKFAIGLFTSNQRGFGFVTVEGMEKDLFISPEKKGKAFYKDTVEVRLLPATKSRDGKRQEAEVVRVIEHGIKTLVATYQFDGKHGVAVPDDPHIPFDLVIHKADTMNAVTGHKVVVEITHYGTAKKNPEGKIIEILGHIDDPGVDILSIIRSYGIPVEFPEDVQEQLTHISQTVEVGEGRKDLRKTLMVTIDGEDAKDLDDAVSLHKTATGWSLGVHIADVSEYVTEGSALDKEALRRGTSCYLVDRVIPMLPHELSNGLCSLNQGEDRYALSCLMELDHEGNVTSYEITPSVIHVSARLSYTGVKKVLEEGDTTEIQEALAKQNLRGTVTKTTEIRRMLANMAKVAKILNNRRVERGSIDFDFPESKIVLDEKGKVIKIYPYEHNEATNLIEDFMLLANETVASHACFLELPFVFRTHAKPDSEKIDQLGTFIRNYGYHIKASHGSVHPKEIRKLLEQIAGSPEEATLSRMTLRSMQQARYTTSCDGHFGLALSYYCHFTSPIRRYPDLQIHRILKESLAGKLTEERLNHYEQILENVCVHSSVTERRADDAERETIKMKKAQYMSERLGEHFEGVISGVTSWGIYVELPNTVEGMVSVSSISDDFYHYDEKSYRLVGEQTGKVYSLGMKMKIVVAAADTVTGKIDFVIEDEGKKERNHERKRSHEASSSK